MYTLLTKYGQTFAFGLGLLLTLATLLFIFTGVSEFEAIAEDDLSRYQTTIFNFGMYSAGFLILFTAVAAVLFGIFQLVTNPKGAIKGIIGIAVILVLAFVLYSMASPNEDMLARMAESEFIVSLTQSKWITASIATALILAVTASIATAAGEIINFFR